MSDFEHITISGAFPLTPNRNYVSFTPEAIKQALAEMDKLPVFDMTSERDEAPLIGWIDGDAYEIEESETEISYKLNATLFGRKRDFSKITNLEFQTADSDEPYSTLKIMSVWVGGNGT